MFISLSCSFTNSEYFVIMRYYVLFYVNSLVIAIMFAISASAPTNEEQDKLRSTGNCDCRYILIIAQEPSDAKHILFSQGQDVEPQIVLILTMNTSIFAKLARRPIIKYKVCGISNRQMRVVGGYETKAHEFPWMAGLTNNGKFQCGASLISKKHILTAAHCVYGFNIQELSVVLADHNRAAPNRLSDIVVRGLRSIKQHEKFDNYTFNNDIAILELDQPVDFTPMVQPACLPKKDVDYSGRNGVVTGWGWTSENDETSDVLRKVTVPIWTKKECGNSHYGEKKISDNMFCAGFSDGKHDACRGDSGGPLHMYSLKDAVMEIIGLVSWGRGCARPNLPGIYTKVSNYIDWMNKALDGECLCHPQNH